MIGTLANGIVHRDVSSRSSPSLDLLLSSNGARNEYPSASGLMCWRSQMLILLCARGQTEDICLAVLGHSYSSENTDDSKLELGIKLKKKFVVFGKKKILDFFKILIFMYWSEMPWKFFFLFSFLSLQSDEPTFISNSHWNEVDSKCSEQINMHLIFI